VREGRTTRRRVVVAIAGAEGVQHAVRLLERLRADGTETHLVLSPAAEQALGADAERVRSGATYRYAHDNQAARIASGSFLADGMVLAPCDAATARGVALGLASDLVLRAADVALKESRPLVIGIAPAVESAETVTRLSGLPGVSVVGLDDSVDAGVDALLAQLGRVAEGS
jgi:polyprenyl P-hydroxybenzoate/phenylacrylic acid decarboxylase-like protein